MLRPPSPPPPRYVTDGCRRFSHGGGGEGRRESVPVSRSRDPEVFTLGRDLWLPMARKRPGMVSANPWSRRHFRAEEDGRWSNSEKTKLGLQIKRDFKTVSIVLPIFTIIRRNFCSQRLIIEHLEVLKRSFRKCSIPVSDRNTRRISGYFKTVIIGLTKTRLINKRAQRF